MSRETIIVYTAPVYINHQSKHCQHFSPLHYLTLYLCQIKSIIRCSACHYNTKYAITVWSIYITFSALKLRINFIALFHNGGTFSFHPVEYHLHFSQHRLVKNFRICQLKRFQIDATEHCSYAQNETVPFEEAFLQELFYTSISAYPHAHQMKAMEGTLSSY